MATPVKVGKLTSFFENNLKSSSGNSIPGQSEKPRRSYGPHTSKHKNNASPASEVFSAKKDDKGNNKKQSGPFKPDLEASFARSGQKNKNTIDINGSQSMIRPDQNHDIDKLVKSVATTSPEESNEPMETRVNVSRNDSTACESKMIEIENQELENHQLGMHDKKEKISSTAFPQMNENIGLSPKVYPHQTVYIKTDVTTALPFTSLKDERKQGNVIKEFSKPVEETEDYQIPNNENVYHAHSNRTPEIKTDLGDFKSNGAIEDTDQEKHQRMKPKQKAVYRRTKPALPPKPQPQSPSSTSPINNDGLEIKRRKIAVNEKNSMHVERKEKHEVEQLMPISPASKLVTAIPTGNDFNFAEKDTIIRSKHTDPKLDPALKDKEQSNTLKMMTPSHSANTEVALSKETENIAVGVNTIETVDKSVVIRNKTVGKEGDPRSSFKSFSGNLLTTLQSEETTMPTLDTKCIVNPNKEQHTSCFKLDKEKKELHEEGKEKVHICSAGGLTGRQPRQVNTHITKPVNEDDGHNINENTCDSTPITEFLGSTFAKKTAPKPNRVLSDQTVPKVSEVGLTIKQEHNYEATQYSATKMQLLKPHESDETMNVKTSSSEESSDTETERESDCRDSGMSERGDEDSTIIGSEERNPIWYMIEVYKPWIKHHIKAPEIISFLELDERDKGRILSKHRSSPCDAVEMLIDVLHSNESPGTWQKFMDALRQKEFTLVYKILKCETENDQRSARKILDLVKFDLRQRIYLPDFLDYVFGKGLLTEDDRQLVNAALKNQGEHTAADVLLERVDKYLPNWDVVFADVLKENHMGEIAGLFRMVEQPDDEIQSRTRVSKKRRKKSERNESNQYQDAKTLEQGELKQSDVISWVHDSGASVEVIEDMKAEIKCLRREIKQLSDRFKQELKGLREDIKSSNKCCKHCGGSTEYY